MEWDVCRGSFPRVSGKACNECGLCRDVCPGEGLDFTAEAWWHQENAGLPYPDFLGPRRTAWFGWASDADVRFQSASGGVATALLQGALERGDIDAAVVVTMDAHTPFAARAMIARTPAEVAAARGSKYTTVPVNEQLRTVRREPARYAVVGLPCHIQGLRLAQLHNPAVRDRVVLAVGIFCGWTSEPQATWVAAHRAGVDPSAVVDVAYRGHGWPGGLRLELRSGELRRVPYPDYLDRYVSALTPPRCRLCPDATAELADVSLGDAWLERFSGSAGVSAVLGRTQGGERLVRDLQREWLRLEAGNDADALLSQRETHHAKRDIYRGRVWLRRLARRSAPSYPGVVERATWHDKVAGAGNLLEEVVFRSLGQLRYGCPR